MTVPNLLRAVAPDRQLLLDVTLAVGVFLLALFVHDPDASPAIPLTSLSMVTTAALTCGALLVRRYAPRPVLVATTGGAATATGLLGSTSPLLLASMIAVFTVAVTGDRRSTWIAWGATVVILAVADHLTATPSFVGTVLPALPWTGVAAAVGDSLRNRRAYVAAVEERAERAERSRESEAHRRVAEERLRIARELHDVVAHGIAVVNVQAGVASHLLHSRPDGARDALAHVREASSTVLDELSDMLNVLRQPGERSDSTAPAPGLGQLGALVASFANAGLVVDYSLTGRPRPVTPTVDLVAYRVLQEALTNAHKHGTGSAHLSISWQASMLGLHVTNRMPAAVTDGSIARDGHGLVGMRERAQAVGGAADARAGWADSSFHVDVRLPILAPAS